MGLKLNLQEKLILDLQGRNSFDKMKRLLKVLIDMFPNQSKRKKKFYKEMGQTLSEEKESELEPISCPMHEDYDEEEDNQKSSKK